MVREQTRQKAEEALVLLEVQGTEALRMQKQTEGVSLAMLIEEKNKAEAVRANAEVSLIMRVRAFVCFPPKVPSVRSLDNQEKYMPRRYVRVLHQRNRSADLLGGCFAVAVTITFL